MTALIAPCGVDCSSCPARRATQTGDDAERARVAALWSKLYRAEIKPADIDCDGCLAGTDRLFGHCTVCAVRRCCLERGLPHCAPCPDYPCAHVAEIHRFAPEAKATLDRLGPARV